ncbi:MAG: hypothetical protein ACHQCF_07565, partial [Solirubrobacterales bacterium]
MLGVGRYLLGVAELAILAGFATLGANRVRARLLPTFSGSPAWLATAVLTLALLIGVAELLGTFGLFQPLPYVLGVALLGLTLRLAVAEGSAAPPAGGAGRGPRTDAPRPPA